MHVLTNILRSENGAEEWIVEISARAFRRVFSRKRWFRRAPKPRNLIQYRHRTYPPPCHKIRSGGSQYLYADIAQLAIDNSACNVSRNFTILGLRTRLQLRFRVSSFHLHPLHRGNSLHWVCLHKFPALRRLLLHLGDPYAESGQTLQGPFSAVSRPNVAKKYTLE